MSKPTDFSFLDDPVEVDNPLDYFESELNEEAPVEVIPKSDVGRTLLQKFRKFGWANGVHIPFASPENQRLEDLVNKKQKRVLELQSELQDHEEHCKTLTNNFNRISEDLNAHQALISYKRSDQKILTNLVSIAERVHSKVLQEKLSDIVLIENLEKRNRAQKKQLIIRRKTIAELDEIVAYDQKLLETYKQRTAAAEAEIDAVGEFKISDDRLTYENETKQMDLGAKRKLLRYRLDHEAMDTAKCQEQFNRAAMEYRKVHEQRQSMVAMWSKTLAAMRHKDKLMKEVAEEYYTIRDHVKEIEVHVQQKERCLKEEQCGIRGLEIKMTECDRKVSALRNQIFADSESLFEYLAAYTTLNADLHYVANLEKLALQKAEALDKQLARLNEDIVSYQKQVNDLQLKRKNELNTTKTSEECIREADKMLLAEEENYDNYTKRLKWIQQCFWERSNEKIVIKGDILGVETRLHRIKTNALTLNAKVMSNLDYLAKRSSKIYRLDLDASNLETRISRIEHDNIDPSYFALQDKIISNKGVEQKLKEEQKFVSKELEILKDHEYKTRREMLAYSEERKNLKTTLFEVDMIGKSNSKLVKKSIREFHDIQIRYSLLQVSLKRLERARQHTREELGGLSEHRALVETVVKERTSEIDVHKSMNAAKLKTLRVATNKLNVQIGEVKSYTDRLKGRFYLTSKMMMGPENANPEEQTFTFQIRKAARDREVLNKEIFRWQECVEEAYQELHAMENVLKIMDAANENFKTSINPAVENSHELIYARRLEDLERAVFVSSNRSKKLKLALQQDINELESKIHIIQQERYTSKITCETKKRTASSAQSELYRQEDKIARWNSLISRLTREVKGYMTEAQAEAVERELKNRFTMEKFECSVTMIDRLLGVFPALRERILSFFQEKEETEALYYRFLGREGSKPKDARAHLPPRIKIKFSKPSKRRGLDSHGKITGRTISGRKKLKSARNFFPKKSILDLMALGTQTTITETDKSKISTKAATVDPETSLLNVKASSKEIVKSVSEL